VRPIDVPGPLGDFEMKVAELFRAEQRRASQRESNNGRIDRLEGVKIIGPLGKPIKPSNISRLKRWSGYEILDLSNRHQISARYTRELFRRPFRAPQMVASVLNAMESFYKARPEWNRWRYATDKVQTQNSRGVCTRKKKCASYI
jgi:hypothetical protein